MESLYHTSETMDKGYKIIRKNQINTSTWSGGTTSELFIYPENANSYAQNFLFKVASATVDLEKSNFTVFQNHDRIIMTLDNKLELVHNNSQKIVLNKYEPYAFDGSANTISCGKVRDFNLIMQKNKCYGDATALSINRNSIIYPRKAISKFDNNIELVYCVSGSLTFKPKDEKNIINAGDLLIIKHEIFGKDYFYSNDDNEICNIIISMITFNN